MKIRVEAHPRSTLTQFADKHGLEMVVVERGPQRRQGVARYYAHFYDVEVKGNCTLISVSGNGDTPEEAMLNYAEEISGKLLVVSAYKASDRKEIWAPTIEGIE